MNPDGEAGKTASSVLPWAGCAALFTGIGLGRFAYSALIPGLVERGWFTAARADYLGAANLAGYALGALVADRAVRGLPLRSVFRLGMAAVALSYFGCALPWGFGWFFAWRFLAGLAGAILMVLAAPTLLAWVPESGRARAGGVIFTGVGLGTAVSGLLVPRMLAWGPSQACLGIGTLGMVLTLAVWGAWPRRSAPAPFPSAQDLSGSGAPSGPPPARAWGIPFLMAAYGASAIGFAVYTVFWVDYIARGLGRGMAVAGNDWMLLGLAAAGGPLAAGAPAGKLGFEKSLRWALGVEALGVALPLCGGTTWILALSSLCVGSSATGVVALTSGRAGELAPEGRRRRVWGWLTAAYSLIYAASAYALSDLFAVMGSWRLLFWIGALALAVACVLSSLGGAFRTPLAPPASGP